MNKIAKALLIALAVYIAWKFFELMQSGAKVAEATAATATHAVKAPFNLFNTVLAGGAWLFDVASGEPVAQATSVLRDTLGGVWETPATP